MFPSLQTFGLLVNGGQLPRNEINILEPIGHLTPIRSKFSKFSCISKLARQAITRLLILKLLISVVNLQMAAEPTKRVSLFVPKTVASIRT